MGFLDTGIRRYDESGAAINVAFCRGGRERRE